MLQNENTKKEISEQAQLQKEPNKRFSTFLMKPKGLPEQRKPLTFVKFKPPRYLPIQPDKKWELPKLKPWERPKKVPIKKYYRCVYYTDLGFLNSFILKTIDVNNKKYHISNNICEAN